jgi:hypothetical protein
VQECNFFLAKTEYVPNRSSSKLRTNISVSGIGIFWFSAFRRLPSPELRSWTKKIPQSIFRPFVIILSLIAIYIILAVKVAAQGEKAVLLSYGKFHHLKGTGLFWIIPIVDCNANWIDHRVSGTSFSAKKR